MTQAVISVKHLAVSGFTTMKSFFFRYTNNSFIVQCNSLTSFAKLITEIFCWQCVRDDFFFNSVLIFKALFCAAELHRFYGKLFSLFFLMLATWGRQKQRVNTTLAWLFKVLSWYGQLVSKQLPYTSSRCRETYRFRSPIFTLRLLCFGLHHLLKGIYCMWLFSCCSLPILPSGNREFSEAWIH